jgi:hypothetical protein
MANDESAHVRKKWTVDVAIDEHMGLTRAKARLRWREKEEVGVGMARLNPDDRNVAEIGDELAVARALTDLGQRISAVSAEDIDAVSRQPSTFTF